MACTHTKGRFMLYLICFSDDDKEVVDLFKLGAKLKDDDIDIAPTKKVKSKYVFHCKYLNLYHYYFN